MTKFILLTLITFIIFSCSEKIEQKDYYKFGKQITPSGKFAIYDYARFGAMAFSSDIVGTELFKINEKFEEGNGIDINGQIAEWISNDTLLVYNFKTDLQQLKDTLPIKTEFKNAGDFIVKKIYYKTNHGGGNEYPFDSVWTTDKTINIRFQSNPKKKNFRTFPLGSVCIKTNLDTIKSIDIFEGVSKSMNFTYLNKDGTTTKGLPSIGTTSFHYKPTKTILKNQLNKKKIFWE
jgi:hypothetical protein